MMSATRHTASSLRRLRGKADDRSLSAHPATGTQGSALPDRDWPRHAFSLAEVLVVIAVLALLLALGFKGGSALLRQAKSRDTEVLLENLKQAIVAYESEVNQARIPYVADLFRKSPPDDVYVHQTAGANIGGCPGVTMASGIILPAAPALTDLRNPATGMLNPPSPASVRHGDIRAMVLAIRLRSAKAAAILDRVDPRFKKSGSVEEAYYQPTDGAGQPSGPPIPLDYYVDSWGTALEYYSTCVCNPSSSTPREAASNAFVDATNGEALLVSYGPDGPDQFAADLLLDPSVGDTTLVGDFFDNNRDGVLNHPLNHDNLYSSSVFKKRMMPAP